MTKFFPSSEVRPAEEAAPGARAFPEGKEFHSIDDLLKHPQKQKYVFFWGHTSSSNQVDKSCFSQWYPAPFVVDGQRYATTEHWMMAQKAWLFNDDAAAQKILATSAPDKAKAIGRGVANFDDTVWHARRCEIVRTGNFHKFSQHPKLKEFLLNTGDKILVEASPKDTVWGIGLAADHEHAAVPERWRGLNLLGFALMDVRAQLRG